MKANKFFAVALAALTLVGFSACNKKPGEEPANYKLNQTQASIAEGETIQLSIEPAATAVWSSSKEEVATVDQTGLVTGVKAGNAIIKAVIGEVELSALVTVTAATKPGDDPQPGDETRHESLKGSEYFLFQLDAVSFEKLPSSVVIADLRPNDVTSFIDVWAAGETYAAANTSGKNFYGEAEGWVAFDVVAPQGWSGGGIRSVAEGSTENPNPANALLDKIMQAPQDYYFHVAMKATDNKSHHFRLYGTTEVDLIIGAQEGDKDFDGNDCDVYFTRDGSWQEIEVPMTVFTNKGLVFNSTTKPNFYVLGWVSGGQVGASLQFDACFIYKK
ncbi:MAG: Ig-like domain-containing protein [Paludibacteraceae bacterium]|nr:Ig-like domain-containing protein [Paludibacteraceae bacterium]